ncbi:MAG: type II secretion system F family protein [Vulcanimicrobiota bacterium]
MLFSYQCIDHQGGVQDGRLKAKSVHAARRQLESKGWQILIIQPLDEGAESVDDDITFVADDYIQKESRATRPEQAVNSYLWGARVRVPGRTVVLFTRQLATMLKNGVPLVNSLDTLSLQLEHPQFGEVVASLATQVTQGHMLSQALSRFPRVFSRVYLTMVRIGEETGQLDAVLDRLADWQEADQGLFQKVKSALTYPGVVLVFSLGLGFIVFYTIIPGFIQVLENMKVELPLITRLVFAVANLVRNPGVWLVAIASIGALRLVLRDVYASDKGGQTLFWCALNLPLVGGLLRSATVSRFTTAAAAMLASGVDLMKTMELAALASGNPLLAADGKRLVANLREGQQVYAHMEGRPDLYPNTVTQMVRVGEETSELSMMLARAGAYYDSEVTYRIEALGAALEPLLLAAVSCVVATMVLSIFLPMYGYLAKLGG